MGPSLEGPQVPEDGIELADEVGGFQSWEGELGELEIMQRTVWMKLTLKVVNSR